MRVTKRRLAWLLALFAALSLIGAACGGDDDTASSSSTTEGAVEGADIDYASLTGTINGTGASFPDVFYQKAKTEFAKVATGLTVNYTKSGSGAGKQDLSNQVVQFAGSDSLVKDEEKVGFKGGPFLYFPTVAAPITVSYNVGGVEELNLTAETLAKIFQAQITTWNDPAIAADNDGVDLPSTAITVVHRSDASGTTSNFTKYLTAAAEGTWTLGSGDTVNWAASTQGAEKNSGVASLIKSTDGAIGYVDLADAVNADLSLASIQNVDGEFVAPTLDAASAALDGAEVADDLTYNPLNAAGAESYPITAPTWILVYTQQPDEATANAVKGWLNFILTDGQELANSVGYAALPATLATKAIAQLDTITVG